MATSLIDVIKLALICMTAASFWPLYREVFKASRDNYLDEWGPFELFPWISISETYILLNSVVATQQLSLLLQWTLFSVYKDEGRLKRKHLTQLSDWLDVLQLVVHWVCSSVLLFPGICHRNGEGEVSSFTTAIWFTTNTTLLGPCLLGMLQPLGIDIMRRLLHINRFYTTPLCTAMTILASAVQAFALLRDGYGGPPHELLRNQAFVFAILAVSWVFRLPGGNPGIRNWYIDTGWIVINHGTYALGQSLLLYIAQQVQTGGFQRAHRSCYDIFTDYCYWKRVWISWWTGVPGQTGWVGSTRVFFRPGEIDDHFIGFLC